MGIAFLYFCLTLVMRSRVQLAIGVIQEAGKALGHMKALLLTPIIQVFGLCLFLVPWIIYVFYLASSGTVNTLVGTTTINGIEQTYTYRTFEYTTNTKYAFLYMIFCYYWTSEFITACGQMLIALSFSNWYFTRDKSTTGTKTVAWVSLSVLLNQWFDNPFLVGTLGHLPLPHGHVGLRVVDHRDHQDHSHRFTIFYCAG
jgi:hypothetical protein